jgi:pimeloyl-ACP methyl ester carboxylesterase
MAFPANKDGDFAEMVEIRLGRSLFCRRINISDVTDDSPQKKNSLLMVHGSCAASSQFDSLVGELRKNGSDLKVRSLCIYMYDQFGCGESASSSDWKALSSTELLLDLETIILEILDVDKETDLYIIGHSYACSQIIQICNKLDGRISNRVRGLVMLSGALKDGPCDNARDGGHWIFKYIPLFMLRRMQKGLSRSFLDAAVHPTNRERLRQKSLEISNRNDMKMCRAYYRQQVYADSEDAEKVKIRSIIIHGRDDHIFPLDGGKHLHRSLLNSKFIIVDSASHQVFEEHPKQVKDEIVRFILEISASLKH